MTNTLLSTLLWDGFPTFELFLAIQSSRTPLLPAPAMLLQRSWTLKRLLPSYCNAPDPATATHQHHNNAPVTQLKTLQDAATAASWPQQRSCSASRRCNFATLQLLLMGPRNAPATLPDVATAASTQRHLAMAWRRHQATGTPGNWERPVHAHAIPLNGNAQQLGHGLASPPGLAPFR